MTLLLGMAACFWEQQERDWQERLFQMEDHAADGREAFRAVARGDLDAARELAKRLAAPDAVPKITEAGQRHLDAVRAEAKRASEAKERREAAEALVAMTGHCAACHGSYGLEASVVLSDEDAAFAALAFESDAYWAAAGLPGETWQERRAAVVEALAGR
jgi:hypothetical protein